MAIWTLQDNIDTFVCAHPGALPGNQFQKCEGRETKLFEVNPHKGS